MRNAAEVHQAIHGYAEGHTLLASSIRLGKRDARTMLGLSDLAGSGGIVGVDGYLTGYPLPESRNYVLAKTWPALEMRRPGCVWTHSLIIDLELLDTFSRHATVESFFVRPEVGRYDFYRSPLAADLDIAEGASISLAEQALAAAIISALYTHPTKSIFFSDEGLPFTAAIAGAWAQQWPSLKAQFRFCTSVAADRSIDGSAFDLQVTRKGIRNSASILKSSLDVRKLRIDYAPWLDAALLDLTGQNRSLSTFFKDCGPVLFEGRKAFVPLATLFCFLQGFPSVAEREAIDALMHSALEALPQRIKLEVIKHAVLASDRASPQTVAIFLEYLDCFGANDRTKAAKHLGSQLIRTDLGRLLAMFDGSPGEADFASKIIQLASSTELVEAAIDDLAMSRALLVHRRDLLKDIQFVSTFVDVNVIISITDQMCELDKKSVIEALIRSGRADLDVRRLRKIGGSAFWDALHALALGGMPADRSHVFAFIRPLCDDADLITRDLSAKLISSALALEAICHATRPDQILNDYGSDPWFVALDGLPRSETFDDKLFVMAYSLSRALGWRTKQPFELAALALPSVYEAAKSDNLPIDSRLLLDGKLADSLFHSWDVCKRLRRSVADLFIDKRGSPSIYLTLLNGDKDFLELAEETADRSGGKAYLKEVRKHLQKTPIGNSDKLKLIELVLG